jgi:hypothetical protein
MFKTFDDRKRGRDCVRYNDAKMYSENRMVLKLIL